MAINPKRKKRNKYENPEDRFLRKNRGPWNKSTGRKYSKESAAKKTPEAKEDARKRAEARRKAIKAGKVSRHDGKDVDHKDGNPRNNSPSNLVAKSPAKNRNVAKKKRKRTNRRYS